MRSPYWKLLWLAPFLTALNVTWINDGGNGWQSGEIVGHADMNAIKTAVDDIETRLSNHENGNLGTLGYIISTSPILTAGPDTSLTSEINVGVTPGGELGGTHGSPTIDDNLTVAGWTLNNTTMTGTAAYPDGTVAAADLANADFGDFTVAAGVATVDTGTINAAKIATGALTAADAAADLATQAELDAKSASTSTDNAVCRFDSTSGDVQNTGVTVDDSDNLDVPGTVVFGGATRGCIILVDTDAGGSTECGTLNGAWACVIDTNGLCDGA